MSAYPLNARNGMWWRDDIAPGERWRVANPLFTRVRAQQQDRIQQLLRWHRLYQNAPMRGFGFQAPKGLGERLALNVVKSCCDSFTAKLAKDQPKPWFVTSGSDWGQQQRAKDLDKFVEAQFYETRLYELAPQMALDACWAGTGILKPYATIAEVDPDDPKETTKKAQIRVDRVLPYELFVDDQDALYGRPSQLWHTQMVDRMRLAWMYRDDPVKHAAIMAASADDDDPHATNAGEDTVSDRIRVTEQWHLPSGLGAKDGLRLITIANADLEDEPWGYDYFPFLFFRRQVAPTGFWGLSLASELAGIQLEINILLQKIQRSHHLLGAGHWMVENGAKINSHQIDNEIGSIIRYSGTPPQLVVGMAVAPEIYQHLDRLYGRAFEITGISQLTAQSQKPAGLNSGKALDTYADIETERFSVSVRAYQQVFLDAARQIVDRTKEIAEEVPTFEVKSVAKSQLLKLRWKDVKLDDEAYTLKLTPANALSSDPVEKMQQIQTMTDAGWIAPEKAQRVLGFPDLEAFEDNEDASYNLVCDLAEAMLHEGKYYPPEPLMNLAEATAIMQLRYLRARRQGAPEDRLELLRRWMVDAQDLGSPQAPPAPEPANDNGQAPIAPGPQPAPAPPANDNGAPPAQGAPPGTAIQ